MTFLLKNLFTKWNTPFRQTSFVYPMFTIYWRYAHTSNREKSEWKRQNPKSNLHTYRWEPKPTTWIVSLGDWYEQAWIFSNRQEQENSIVRRVDDGLLILHQNAFCSLGSPSVGSITYYDQSFWIPCGVTFWARCVVILWKTLERSKTRWRSSLRCPPSVGACFEQELSTSCHPCSRSLLFRSTSISTPFVQVIPSDVLWEE